MSVSQSNGGWSRRDFLGLLGAAGLSGALGFPFAGRLRAEELLALGDLRRGNPLRVQRARDLLSFQLELLNLEAVRRRGQARTELHLGNHAANGYLVLQFTGQHINEQAVWDRGEQKVSGTQPASGSEPDVPLTYRLWKGDNAEDPDGDLNFLGRGADAKHPVRASDARMLHGMAGAWISGPSQLVFEVPPWLLPLPFDLDTLLGLCASGLDLVVAPGVAALTGADSDAAHASAVLDGNPEPALPHHPGALGVPTAIPATSIEFPSLLNLSPYRTARWRLRPRPAGDRAELWGLELEPPDATLPGQPRAIQPRGHLFAFGWRSSRMARWPVTQPLPASDPTPATQKYAAAERPKTGLYEATRKLLVKQLYEDNNDVTALRFRLSALGATARLHYAPALEAPLEQNLEGGKRRDDDSSKAGAAADEGTLAEWEHKTETGRDFYSKETFSGYWMPYGFKAEVVTITERLLASAQPPPEPSASQTGSLVELAEDESRLTALLVARKFARIRGRLTFDFTEPESADFAQEAAEAGRQIGWRKIEMLVDRTPVLANVATVPPCETEADQIAAVANGEDAIVDGGSGVDAAREIFWPRVFDSGQDEHGQPVRQRVLYKFPARITHLDGTQHVTEFPMLFVPTLTKGEVLYRNAKEALRLHPLDAKVPLVPLPPPAVVAPGDLGTPDQIKAIAGHLGHFLPASFKPVVAGDNPPTAAAAAMVAEGVNLALGNLPVEIYRRVTGAADVLKAIVNGGDAAFSQWLTGFRVGSAQDADTVADIVRDVARTVAWGTQVDQAIDAKLAAERLERLFSGPVADWKKALGLLNQQLDAVKGLSAANADLLKNDLNKLGQLVADPSFDPAKPAFLTSFRQLLVHWVVLLGNVWVRRDWDEVFAQVVDAVEGVKKDTGLGASAAATRLSALQKELQRGLLRVENEFTIPNPAAPDHPLIVRRPELAASDPANSATTLPVVEKGIDDAVKAVLDPLAKLVRNNAAVLDRLLTGLEAALPEERALRARLGWLIQDALIVPPAELNRRLTRLFDDAQTHLAFMLTHYEDGRARWESFLENALSGQELILQARRAAFDAWNTAQEKVRTEFKNILAPASAAVAQTQAGLQQLLMQTNPERLRERFDNFISLTGGRLQDLLKEDCKRILPRAVQILAALKGARDKAPTDARAVRALLEEIFGLARDLVGRYRATLIRLVEGILAKPELLEQLQTKLKEAAAGIEELGSFPGRLDEYLKAEAGTYLTWRLGAAGRDLIDDILRSLAGDPAMRAAALRTATELNSFGKDIDEDLRSFSAVSRAKLDDLQRHLAQYWSHLDVGLQARVTALAALAASWTDAEQRAEDILEHLAVVLWGVLNHSAEKFDAVLGQLLQAMGGDLLDTVLKQLPGAVQATAALRQIVGEAEGFENRIKNLVGDEKKVAESFQSAAKTLAANLASGLQQRLDHAEGDMLALAKRAALSLPSPALFMRYEDQTRKAIFQTSQVLMSVQTVGQGVRSFLAHPRLENLSVLIPGVDGQQVVTRTGEYLAHGLRDAERAKNEVFAEMKNALTTAAQNTGIADVAAQVQALSREAGNLAKGARDALNAVHDQVQDEINKVRAGAVAKLENLKQELAAKAADLFPDAPKLFNILPLKNILSAIQSPGSLPKILAHQFPDRIERAYSLSTATQPVNLGIVAFTPVDNCRFRIDSHATVRLPAPGRPARPPTYSVRGQMDAFAVEVAQLLRINFISLSFVSENGSFDCVPKLGKPGSGDTIQSDGVVEFLGPLTFVNDLRKALGKFLGKTGLQLSLADDSIYAGMRLRIPDLTFGAVAVTNIALNFGLGLPLKKGPLRFQFALSDRIETFRVAVLIFAGGGFFGLQLSSDPKYCKVAGALEFGASLSLSLAVISGSVSAMGGMYFSWSGAGSNLDAYLRICGTVDVLGIIDVSIVIYLALGYQRDAAGHSYLHGEASITIQVKIGFFSKSFSVSYEKTIGGSNAGEAFLTPPARWDDSGPRVANAVAPRRGRPARRRGAPEGKCFPWGSAPITNHAPHPPLNLPPLDRPHRFKEAMPKDDFETYWKAFDPRLLVEP